MRRTHVGFLVSFTPSRSLVAPGVFLASWYHGPWISEVGRTLTSLFGGLGTALKSVHNTGFARLAFGPRSPCVSARFGCVRLSAGRAEPSTPRYRPHSLGCQSAVPCPVGQPVDVDCTSGPTGLHPLSAVRKQARRGAVAIDHTHS